MAVCSFFLRGACKFGNNCHNEHPQDAVNKRAPFGSTSSSWTPASTASQKTIPYSLETMTKDFDNAYDKPLWPLSTYGPAKHEPNLLPPLDESFEELRLKAVTAAKSGTINEYIKYEQEKTANAEQIFANVRRDMKGAFEAAKKQTFTAEGAAGPSTSSGSAFGGGTTSALGGGSAFGGSGSAFGGSNNGASAFGKPSTFGALPNSTATSAFGSALPTGQSAFGQPAFGRPAAPTSAFGQPAFGQPSQPATSAFGQSAQPSTSAFGQSAQQPTSAFGQTSQPTSAFGQSSVFKPATAFGSTGGTSAFGGGASSGGNAGGGFAAFASGGPSAFSTAASSAPSSSGPVFGQSAFGGGGSLGQTGSVFGNGQPAQGSTTSAFGQTGALGQQQQPTSAFGQAAPATSAFGPAQPATSAFGSTPAQATMSAFGQSASATPTSAFGHIRAIHPRYFGFRAIRALNLSLWAIYTCDFSIWTGERCIWATYICVCSGRAYRITFRRLVICVWRLAIGIWRLAISLRRHSDSPKTCLR
ncbi:hypothetical protein BV25DRAFT_1833732 [Artomyces pyxidatus]|uniref:Uncharacterized protein n=1 Tax=Artomyces pyxidatus TaxID=48021 RepID=A0ACB8TJ60_9AGAM|nr:hypothetical protein BV25DRAFT_1833732 [Artomyces pyxidatus]